MQNFWKGNMTASKGSLEMAGIFVWASKIGVFTDAKMLHVHRLAPKTLHF